jgi:hypothetical protein
MPAKKGYDTGKILPLLRVMTVEATQWSKKEAQIVDSSARLIVQALQRSKSAQEILSTALPAANAHRKTACSEKTNEAITDLRDKVNVLATAVKTPPPELLNSLRLVCIFGVLSKCESFGTFAQTILKSIFSAAVVTDLSNPAFAPDCIQQFQSGKPVSDLELIHYTRGVVAATAAGSVGKFDELFGPILAAKEAEAAKVVYTKKGPSVQLIDLPAFDRSAWPEIVQELKAAMS